MINEQELQELEKLAEKNPLVGKLLDFYNNVYATTAYESLITLRGQIRDFNQQLSITDEEVERTYNEGEEDEYKLKTVKGRIDLFGSKDDKEFERGFKYLTDMAKLEDVCEALMAKLSPKELESMTTKKKISKNTMIAA